MSGGRPPTIARIATGPASPSAIYPHALRRVEEPTSGCGAGATVGCMQLGPHVDNSAHDMPTIEPPGITSASAALRHRTKPLSQQGLRVPVAPRIMM
jgi:hypothetical protein